jgi:HlyD family secretion protein
LNEAQAEKERNLALRRHGAELQLKALAEEKANTERELEGLNEQGRSSAEQSASDEQLLSKGLISMQQVLQDREKVVALNRRIDALRLTIRRIEADRKSAGTELERLDLEMQAAFAERDRRLAGLKSLPGREIIVTSPTDGNVTAVSIGPGTLVDANAPILQVQPEGNTLEVLAYVPWLHAVGIRAGMPAEISPSTLGEEFGFLLGRVVSVGGSPAGFDALMRCFQNETLVRSMIAGGQVAEVRVSLDPDPATPSGYRWSSSTAEALALTSGTLCSVRVVTRQQHPVNLLFPQR